MIFRLNSYQRHERRQKYKKRVEADNKDKKAKEAEIHTQCWYPGKKQQPQFNQTLIEEY